MARVFKHICSAYGCNLTAKYRREIDGHLFKFCEAHKYCLNHARAENIINMIKTSMMTTPDILKHFNYEICGFSKGVLSETVLMLENDNHICTIEGFLSPFKDETTCLFPGCLFRRVKTEYCLSHANMPKYKVVTSLINSLSSAKLTSATLSEITKIPLKETAIVLCKLAKTGHVEITKIGIINHYSSA